MTELPRIATLSLPAGRFAFVYARGEEEARTILAENRASLPPSPEEDLTGIPLNRMQASMAYPELFHGSRTANNVAYIFNAGPVSAEKVDLAKVALEMTSAFPLLAATVELGEDGLSIKPETAVVPGERHVLSVMRSFDDERACIDHLLATPVSLFEGPLFYLTEVVLRGRRHVAVLFHHALGDHFGQLLVLRKLKGLLRDGYEPAGAANPDLSFVPANLKLEMRYAAEADACLDFWTGYAGAGQPPEQLSDRSLWIWQNRQTDLARDGFASLQQASMRAYRKAIRVVLGDEAPLVQCLFSMRDKKDGLGFYTVAAPIRFDDGLLAAPSRSTDEEEPFHDRMAMFRRNCIVGSEEILSATGWNAKSAACLFNFVTMSEADLRFLKETVLPVPSEGPRTDLDLTVIAAGTELHLHAGSTFDGETLGQIMDLVEENLRAGL